MAVSPLRYKKLIKEIPKHKTAEKALLAAGFSKQTARTQSKSVLRSAIKHQAREILEGQGMSSMKSKELMSEILGLTREDLFGVLKKILFQDKDLNTAYKVLAPLIAQHGVELKAEEGDKITVPVLNVIVEKSSPIIEGGEAESSIVNTQ